MMALHYLFCLMIVTLGTLKNHYYQTWKTKNIFKTISWTSINVYNCLRFIRKLKWILKLADLLIHKSPEIFQHQ